MEKVFYPNLEKNSIAQVEAQYNLFPYPRISLLARLQKQNTFLMNYLANIFAAYGSSHFSRENPEILVVGCGTFEPCVVALANPGARITAIDLSKKSLQRLRWHFIRHGLFKNIKMYQGDFLEILPKLGKKFDFIIATGVIHHLPNPEDGIRVLHSVLGPMGILRLMLYSQQGREKIYQIRELAKILQLNSAKELKKFISLLPANHPLKIHFYIYGDSETDAGITDGFLHAIDHCFSAIDCRKLLLNFDLEATRFLHPVGSRPKDFYEILQKNNWIKKDSKRNFDDWEKIYILDCLRELETNFHFIAVNKEDKKTANAALENNGRNFFYWNPQILKVEGGIYSRLCRKIIRLPKNKKSIQGKEIKDVIEQFGKKQVEEWLESLVAMEKRDNLNVN